MVADYSGTINRFTELDAYPMPNIAKMVEDIAKYNIFSTLDSSLLTNRFRLVSRIISTLLLRHVENYTDLPVFPLALLMK